MEKRLRIFKLIATIEFTFSYILAVESFVARFLGLTGIIRTENDQIAAFTTTTAT